MKNLPCSRRSRSHLLVFVLRLACFCLVLGFCLLVGPFVSHWRCHVFVPVALCALPLVVSSQRTKASYLQRPCLRSPSSRSYRCKSFAFVASWRIWSLRARRQPSLIDWPNIFLLRMDRHRVTMSRWPAWLRRWRSFSISSRQAAMKRALIRSPLPFPLRRITHSWTCVLHRWARWPSRPLTLLPQRPSWTLRRMDLPLGLRLDYTAGRRRPS